MVSTLYSLSSSPLASARAIDPNTIYIKSEIDLQKLDIIQGFDIDPTLSGQEFYRLENGKRYIFVGRFIIGRGFYFDNSNGSELPLAVIEFISPSEIALSSNFSYLFVTKDVSLNIINCKFVDDVGTNSILRTFTSIGLDIPSVYINNSNFSFGNGGYLLNLPEIIFLRSVFRFTNTGFIFENCGNANISNCVFTSVFFLEYAINIRGSIGVFNLSKNINRIDTNYLKISPLAFIGQIQIMGDLVRTGFGGFSNLFPNSPKGDILSFTDNGSGGTSVNTAEPAFLPLFSAEIYIECDILDYNGGWFAFNITPVSFDIPAPFVGSTSTGRFVSTLDETHPRIQVSSSATNPNSKSFASIYFEDINTPETTIFALPDVAVPLVATYQKNKHCGISRFIYSENGILTSLTNYPIDAVFSINISGKSTAALALIYRFHLFFRNDSISSFVPIEPSGIDETRFTSVDQTNLNGCVKLQYGNQVQVFIEPVGHTQSFDTYVVSLQLKE